ncbi:CoA-binding protein [Candidatus Micrarchaeota archaeon]|nr:CoA-binding protein [Candidatus Micrarchaeota archaeon]MBU1930727.1 CoA-binding protein [Candidatus Micrarchaeota archaeon]
MASEIQKMLQLRNIAIVGLSKDPAKKSHKVAVYLKTHGYRIVPVNPLATSMFNSMSYPTLSRIPSSIAETIDLVLVFGPSREALEVLLQALKLQDSFGRVKGIWLQKGIKNAKTKAFAKKAGLLFVQDKCIMTEHAKKTPKIRKSKPKK